MSQTLDRGARGARGWRPNRQQFRWLTSVLAGAFLWTMPALVIRAASVSLGFAVRLPNDNLGLAIQVGVVWASMSAGFALMLVFGDRCSAVWVRFGRTEDDADAGVIQGAVRWATHWLWSFCTTGALAAVLPLSLAWLAAVPLGTLDPAPAWRLYWYGLQVFITCALLTSLLLLQHKPLRYVGLIMQEEGLEFRPAIRRSIALTQRLRLGPPITLPTPLWQRLLIPLVPLYGQGWWMMSFAEVKAVEYLAAITLEKIHPATENAS